MDQQRFSVLILNKLKNSLTADEEQELQIIIASDEVYANQHRFFMEYWNDKDSDNTHSQRLFDELQVRIEKEERKTTKVTGSNNTKRWFLAAASIVLLITAGIFTYNSPPRSGLRARDPQMENEISTTLSGKKSIQLEDGSIVRLNGKSSLSKQKITGNKREISLTGEAFFEIKKDPKRPFIIHTHKMDILVLGTSFNVRAYPNEELQQTALIEGKIKVILHNEERSVIYLKPNDKLTIKTSDAGKISSIKEPEYTVSRLEKYDDNDSTAVMETAWINDHLVFKDQTFETLANQLEIRYGTPVVFKSEALKKYRFSGTFKKENLHEVLYILSRTDMPFKYEFKNGHVYIN